MRSVYSRGRDRLALVLRVVSGLSLVVLALAVFWRPLNLVLGPKMPTSIQQIGLPRMLQPKAATGFMVRVVSEPSGGRVSINGAERGSAPFFGNVACQDGQEVTLVVEKQGYSPWRREVPCRVGGELTVRARLGE